jgi:hypothetical protein
MRLPRAGELGETVIGAAGEHPQSCSAPTSSVPRTGPGGSRGSCPTSAPGPDREQDLVQIGSEPWAMSVSALWTDSRSCGGGSRLTRRAAGEAGGRGRAAGRGRSEQQADRHAPVHLRTHLGQPRPQHPEQARVQLPEPDRGLGALVRRGGLIRSRRCRRAGSPAMRHVRPASRGASHRTAACRSSARP